MHLGLRLLFGFFVVTGIAAYFVLRVFVAEIRPSARDVTEDVLIDSANLLAEQVAPDLRELPAGGTLEDTRFARSIAAYAKRPVDAQIWGLRKQTLDFRVYVTDANGRVVFDSGPRPELGADYSRWRDVARTLRGEYGARATREVPTDGSTSVMYVAAPVTDAGRTLGVLTIAKPQATVHRFIERAEDKVMAAGAWLLVLSLAIGVAVTLWTVHSVRKLRRYAQQASAGERRPVPALPGELGELAQAMGEMRERLDGRHEVEQTMRAMTHELKSPLTAIGAAAELLHDELPRDDRERFAGQIGEQVQRLRAMVERLLELSKLEGLQAPEHPLPLSLAALVRAQLQAQAASLAQRGLSVRWLESDDALVEGDGERLSLAISNLLANAIAFAPEGSALDVAVRRLGAQLVFELRDHGPGVPDYAWPQLGRRFFSLPRQHDGAKGNGLGLAIVAQVAALHGGRVEFVPESPGLRVRFVVPVAPSAP